MNHRELITVSFYLLVLHCVAAAGMAGHLLNSDFELGEIDNLPQDWERTNWSAPTPPIIRTDEDVHSGKGCLAIFNNGKSWQTAFQRLENISPGKRYRITWWAKTDGVTGGEVEVVSYPAGDKLWFRYEPKRQTPDGKGWDYVATFRFSRAAWTRYTLEFTAPNEKDVYLVLKLYPASYKKANTWVRFDDITIEEVGLGDSAEGASSELPTNLITNGSFEFGLQDWHSTGDRLIRYEFELDGESPFHGRYCLKRIGGRKTDVALAKRLTTWSFPSGLISNWFPAEPGHRYYLTFAARGSTKSEQVLTATIRNADLYDKRKYPSKRAELADKWQVFKLETLIPNDYSVRKLLVQITCTGGPFYLDAVCVTKDKLADERTMKDENVGVAALTERVGNTFDCGREAHVVLEARNVGDETRTVRVEYRIVDVFDTTTQKDSFHIRLAPRSSKKHTVTLPANRRGRFDMHVKVLDENGQLIRKTTFPFAILKPIRGDANSPIATNIHAHRHPTLTLKDSTRLLARYGIAWVRLWWGWNLAQLKEDEPLDLSEFDRELEIVEAAGLNPMPVLTLVYWRMHSLEKSDFTYWNRFVKAVISRYRDRVKVWEVWNEPAMYPPEKLRWYVELVKNTWTIAKQIDPTCRIIACSPGDTSTPKVWNTMLGIREFLKMGGARYCDLIGLHPYASVNAPIWQDLQGSINAIRRWIREVYGGQNVIITEAGVYTSQGGYLNDSKNVPEASSMVQDWLIAWINETQYFHFAADASPLYRMDIWDPEIVPNAIFCAMNHLAEQVQGSSTPSWATVNKSIGGVYAIRWQRGDMQVVALWCLGFPKRRLIRLRLTCRDATLTDMFGNQIALKSKGSDLSVPIRTEVSYLALPRIPERDLVIALAGAREVTVATAHEVERIVGVVAAGEQFMAGYRPEPKGQFEPDEKGFIRDWLVIGPFANPGARGSSVGFDYDFLKPLGGEANVRLLEGMSVVYEYPEQREFGFERLGRLELKAKPIHSPTAFINLAQLMPIKQYVVAYAYCRVRVPEETKARLLVGSDDGIKVWLNGKLVLNRRVYRGAMPDQDGVSVTLHKGENHLLVKVDTDIGGWEFYLRFVGEGGKPPHVLTVWR